MYPDSPQQRPWMPSAMVGYRLAKDGLRAMEAHVGDYGVVRSVEDLVAERVDEQGAQGVAERALVTPAQGRDGWAWMASGTRLRRGRTPV
jgi:hypothetical protein